MTCAKCHHSTDDHGSRGHCLTCARNNGPFRPGSGVPAPSSSQDALGEVTLWTCPGSHPVAVTMPAATTAGSGALRMAEALGLDFTGAEYFLVDARTREVVADNSVVALLDGRMVFLGVRK